MLEWEAARQEVTNVRNLTSPFRRSSLKDPARRCLLPVTDFCEWEGDKGAKREHWFSRFVAASLEPKTGLQFPAR